MTTVVDWSARRFDDGQPARVGARCDPVHAAPQARDRLSAGRTLILEALVAPSSGGDEKRLPQSPSRKGVPEASGGAGPSNTGGEIRVRILEGTLEAIGRHGLRKLGMSDAASAAGVSRGTLYRYYPSKEALLSALFDYERHRFEDQVNRTLAAVAEGHQRLERHLEFILSYLRNHPALAGLIETEPRFVLGFLEAHFDSFRRATRTMLVPVLGDAEVLGRDHVTIETLSDLLFRVLLSFFLFPKGSALETSSVLAISAVVADLSALPHHPSGGPGASIGASPASGAKNGALRIPSVDTSKPGLSTGHRPSR